MKTGYNLIYRRELQKEIYPETEFGSFFGCIDAPENMPAGCMIAFDCGGGNAQPLQGWTSRERDWYMDQSVRIFGPPKPTEKRGRPATGKAKTGAERIAKMRQERKQQGMCPCCGQKLPAKTE